MAGTPIAIRPATAADIPAVTDIVERAYGDYVERLGIRPAPLDADHGAAVRAGAVHVAEQDGVAGLIVLAVEPGAVLVENVAVDPAHQHRGIGRALLAFAEEHTRERGRAVVRLYTHRAMTRNLRVYEALGYRRVQPPPGDRSPRVYLAKRLSGGGPDDQTRR